MSLQSHIANELQNSAALSAAHARELMKMATGRVAEINARYQAIATARGFSGIGQVRRAALESGDVQAVEQLDHEAELLDAERQILKAQAARLNFVFQDARAREAADAAPQRHKALADALKRAEAARAAFEQALSDADAAYINSRDALVHAQAGGHSPLGAPERVIERIDALRPWTTQARSHLFALQPSRLRETLLVGPHPVRTLKQPSHMRETSGPAEPTKSRILEAVQ